MYINKKVDKKLLFSIIFNLLILVFCLVVFECKFETNDDYYMKLITSGKYNGNFDFHIIYSNVIIGYYLVWISNIFPNIPCYEISQYMLILLSLVTMTYILLKKKNKIITCLTIGTIFTLSLDLYLKMQYTKTAGILACAGYMSIIYYLEKENKMSFFGIFLIVLSFAIRKEHFFACSAICIGFYIPTILLSLRKKDINILKKLFFIGLISLSFVMGFSIINSKSYSSEEWREYSIYNKYRTELFDNGFPNYDINENVYESLDINRNALTLFESWVFKDYKKINNIKMKQLIDVKDNDKTSLGEVVYSLINFYKNYSSKTFIITLAIFLLIFFVFFNKHSMVHTISLSEMIVMSFFVMIYCYYHKNHGLEYRVVVSCLYCLILGVLYIFDDTCLKTPKINLIIPTATLMLLGLVFNTDAMESINIFNKESINERNILKEVNNINESGDYYYVVNDSLYLNKLFICYDEPVYKNVINLGGWLAKSPIDLYIEKTHGISNPLEDLTTHKSVKIICDNENVLQLLITYLKDYYCSEIHCHVAYENTVKVYCLECIK